MHPSYEVAALRYYLRRSYCTVLPRSIADVDVKALATNRLFVVLTSRSLKPTELSRWRAAVKAMGREGESLHAHNISVVEYRRLP